MVLNNRVYDILKWLVVLCIPTLTTFYTTLAPLFGWYDPGVVAQVSSALCVCLGSLIGISTAQYNKAE